MGKPKTKAKSPQGPTLGEVMVATGLLDKIALTTRSIITRAVAQADQLGRVSLKVVTCHTCTAPKACCSLTTAVCLYEGLPIAARLIAEGRDTPALRAELRSSAEQMENSPLGSYKRPCVLLDAAERCTVYTDRPATCGTALVYSPALACSDPTNKSVDSYRSELQAELPLQVEEGVRVELGLPKGDQRYIGTLPRMVLLCLQAWHRPDFARFFAQHGPAAAAGLGKALGR